MKILITIVLILIPMISIAECDKSIQSADRIEFSEEVAEKIKATFVFSDNGKTLSKILLQTDTEYGQLQNVQLILAPGASVFLKELLIGSNKVTKYLMSLPSDQLKDKYFLATYLNSKNNEFTQVNISIPTGF